MIAEPSLALGRDAAVPALRPVLRRALRGVIDAVPALAYLRDAALLRRRMRAALGYEPNFARPQTFNEKVAAKALRDRDPWIPLTSDKVAVRSFVAERLGADFLIPLVGVYSCAAEIPWEHLPGRFVLKASHGSGMTVPVHDKVAADRDSILRMADGWLAESHYAWTGEWGYRDVPPRLLVEEMLQDDAGRIPEDYKFFVFHGRPRLLHVHLDRFERHRMLWFDLATLSRMPIGRHDPMDSAFTLPPETREMAAIAARLAEGFSLARVDLYLARGRVWFGEITHYPGGAVIAFDPPEYDSIIGEMVDWAPPPTRLAAIFDALRAGRRGRTHGAGSAPSAAA